MWIFQVFIWGDGADRLCLRHSAWCEALLTSLEATVLFGEGEQWRDLEGTIKMRGEENIVAASDVSRQTG